MIRVWLSHERALKIHDLYLLFWRAVREEFLCSNTRYLSYHSERKCPRNIHWEMFCPPHALVEDDDRLQVVVDGDTEAVQVTGEKLGTICRFSKTEIARD